MIKFKSILKLFMPPIITSALSSRKAIEISKENDLWSGNYASWREASDLCTGYESDVILEKCRNALLKVKSGEAVYERDSFLFDKVQYSWGLLAGLQKATLENNGNLNVLDFGGSLGSTYYQNKGFLSGVNSLTWSVVEQEHFVNCGKENFQNAQLKFYYSIEDCLRENKPNILLLSSVLQYLENPYGWIEKFVLLNIPYIIIDRTGFTDESKDILTIQNVPAEIYKASYPSWFFSKTKFEKAFASNYFNIAEFDSGFTSPAIINNYVKVYWSGFIFKRK